MSTTALPTTPSIGERSERGEGARKQVPPTSHADWQPDTRDHDPVDLLIQQNDDPGGRPGSGAAWPDDGLAVHLLSRLGEDHGYRSGRHAPPPAWRSSSAGMRICPTSAASPRPERQLLFGLNDFDETLPGPFEYDVKRMSASFTIAAANNGFAPRDIEAMTLESARSYREAMREFADMRTLDVWYAHLSEATINEMIEELRDRSERSRPRARRERSIGRGRARPRPPSSPRRPRRPARPCARPAPGTACTALPRFAALVDGRHRIVSQPPVVVPLRELAHTYGIDPEEVMQAVEDQFRAYPETLNADRRQLLQRFSIVDVARKVVGVGSVGTRAWIVLLEGRDSNDPLFLQVKEATRSVLEDHLPPSQYENPGERVVQGQRLMQAASDIFLGWTKGVQDDRFYYWRQLRDMKASAVVEAMTARRPCASTPACADGPWPTPTPDPVTPSRSRNTSAETRTSKTPSPASRSPTPSRTSETTRPSSTPSRAAG